jgi:hypothetical protein
LNNLIGSEGEMERRNMKFDERMKEMKVQISHISRHFLCSAVVQLISQSSALHCGDFPTLNWLLGWEFFDQACSVNEHGAYNNYNNNGLYIWEQRKRVCDFHKSYNRAPPLPRLVGFALYYKRREAMWRPLKKLFIIKFLFHFFPIFI